jgi:cytochrome c553
MNAIDEYHGLGGTEYMAQLRQLIKISALVADWEIEHGTVDSGSKNKKETARRGVLSTLRSNDIPLEIADVYQQAKTAGNQPDVHLLMQLMDAAQGNPAARGPIESDYATELRTYQAGGGDSTHAMGILGGSKFFAGAGGTSLGTKVNSVRGLEEDPTYGMIPTEMLDAPDRDEDSENMKNMKKERRKLRALVPALRNLSDVEIMAISAYTDEGGYTPMVGLLRGGRTVSGDSKKARQNKAKSRVEVQQANLMAASALNKLPDWDGSPVYRGEDIGWLGHDPTAGETIVLKSFTSTASDVGPARGFAHKGTPTTSAVWTINGVTNQGKDIAELSLLGKQEAEVLLKPYTRLRIDQVNPGEGYAFDIQATAL